ASQVPEDLAVVRTSPERGEWLAAVHVCAPSHWAPAEKLGRDFPGVHAPVPGFERVNAAAPALVEAMVRRGPFVRFGWGISGDDRLNHHPEPPEGISREAWHPQPFTGPGEPFYVRVERQVLWGLPEVGASLFAIRLSFVPAGEIRADPRLREGLRSALRSMSPASRAYKGLAGCCEEIIGWLGGC
ncbi:MAG TPA: heme-dependent oxidative N-demethylase subunit alpha family protein, partial [Armatimonadota bacterium]|nr:heme-dependent oxidative N-demethylase subunit alpha family protein [Armatimonadota bacterium]